MDIFDNDSKYGTFRQSFSDDTTYDESSVLSTIESTELAIIHQNLLGDERDNYGTVVNVTQTRTQIGTCTYNLCNRVSKNVKLAVGIGLVSVAAILISALAAEGQL